MAQKLDVATTRSNFLLLLKMKWEKIKGNGLMAHLIYFQAFGLMFWAMLGQRWGLKGRQKNNAAEHNFCN